MKLTNDPKRINRQALAKVLPFVTIGVAAFIFLSLHFGWLYHFFQGSDTAEFTGGADYFSAPKAYVNLLAGHSVYDSWGLPSYNGGIAYTMYLAHPAFSVFVASWFSFFSPWTSYWLFVFFTMGVMAYCGHLIAGTTKDPLKKQLSYFILICSFVTYYLLYLGNIHGVFVLGITFIFVGVFDLTYGSDARMANGKILAGLLISLFTKPVALLMMPLLLLTKETRVTALKALAIYAFVSFLFIVLPIFNPEGIGLSRLAHIVFDFNFIRQNMDIHLTHSVNEYMKDNSFHWLSLIAQSDQRFSHIQNISFPVFMDTLTGHNLPSFIYQLPLYISIILSAVIPFVRKKRIRLESTLLLLFAISLLYFISYSYAWEYQLTSVLPAMALLPSLSEKNVFYKRYIPLMFCLGMMVSLPALYFLHRPNGMVDYPAYTWARLDRIVPVYLLFWTMILQIIVIARGRLIEMGPKTQTA